MEYLLTTHHLTKTYGRHKAVDGVSLHLRQGTSTASSAATAPERPPC